MRGNVLGLVVALVLASAGPGAAAENPDAIAPPEWVWLQQSELPCAARSLPDRGDAPSNENGAQGGTPASPRLPSRCRYRLDLHLVQAQPIDWRSAPFAVDGIALGSRVPLYSQTYLQYECTPSEQYAGFIWCNRKRTERGPRGEILFSSTIMHSSDGTVQYVNRAIAPFFWDSARVNRTIARLSAQFRQQPRLLNLTRSPFHPGAVIAIWGDLVLEPLDAGSMADLATIGEVRKGILVDFIGHFAHSAQWGLPVYRFTGGAGSVLVASFERGGRGYYRLFAINADALPYPSRLAEAAPPPEVEPQANRWHLGDVSGENASLMYGGGPGSPEDNYEASNVLFLNCARRSGAIRIGITVGEFRNGFEGQRVTVSLAIGAAQVHFAGELTTGMEGYYAETMVHATDPIFSAMKGPGMLVVVVDNKWSAAIPLKGAGGKVATFIAACTPSSDDTSTYQPNYSNSFFDGHWYSNDVEQPGFQARRHHHTHSRRRSHHVQRHPGLSRWSMVQNKRSFARRRTNIHPRRKECLLVHGANPSINIRVAI